MSNILSGHENLPQGKLSNSADSPTTQPTMDDVINKYPHIAGTTEGDESRITIKKKDLKAAMQEWSSLQNQSLIDRVSQLERDYVYWRLEATAKQQRISELEEKDNERLKALIKEGFILLQQQWKKTVGQIDTDWEKFKTENNL